MKTRIYKVHDSWVDLPCSMSTLRTGLFWLFLDLLPRNLKIFHHNNFKTVYEIDLDPLDTIPVILCSYNPLLAWLFWFEYLLPDLIRSKHTERASSHFDGPQYTSDFFVACDRLVCNIYLFLSVAICYVQISWHLLSLWASQRASSLAARMRLFLYASGVLLQAAIGLNCHSAESCIDLPIVQLSSLVQRAELTRYPVGHTAPAYS